MVTVMVGAGRWKVEDGRWKMEVKIGAERLGEERWWRLVEIGVGKVGKVEGKVEG